VARGNADEAVREYDEVIRLAPRTAEAHVALADLNLALGKRDAALKSAQEAARLQPQSGAAHLALAKSLLATGKVDEARREAELLTTAAPSLAETHVLMGRVLYRKQDWAGATRSYERALALDPSSIDALTGLAGIDARNNRLGQAQRRIQAQLAKTPKDSRVLILAARAQVAQGDLAAGEATLKAAIDADPSYMDAYRLLGQLYVREKKLDDARNEYDRISRERPKNVASQTMAAMILQVQNRGDEARARYQKILELDPQAAVAANNLAYMDAESNSDLNIALQLAQTAKSRLPDDPDVSDTIGWVYVRKGLATLGDFSRS